MNHFPEAETGGLNSLHNYLCMPGEWCMKEIVRAMSPELGRDRLSFPEKMLETADAIAKLAILILPATASAVLASTSFVAKELVQLVVPSTITEFGRLYHHPEEWVRTDNQPIRLPQLEAHGLASCDYQTRGPNVPIDNPQLYGPLRDHPEQDAHWSQFDRAKLEGDLQNYISHSAWEDVPRVIASLKFIGVDSLRLSPPESLYPTPDGTYNEIAIGRFREILQELIDGGISVHFTCFHFTYPQYIEDSGGYLNPENCERFVSYCERMCEEFHPYVRAFCTINEPAVFAFQKHFRAVHAGGDMNCQKMGQLMINLIKMHNRAYTAMKAIHPDAIIGFSHDVIHFKPHSRWNPIEALICSFLTRVFHRAYIEFYRSGTFELSIPIPAWLHHLFPSIPEGVHAAYTDPAFPRHGYLDRIFLQDYGLPEISIFNGGAYLHPALYHPPWGCPADPYALYHGIREVYEITRKPIEITETGCPVPKEPTDGMTLEQHQARQAEFIRRAYYAIAKAIEDGYPVRAIYIWAALGSSRLSPDAIDWWEWDEGPRLLFALLNKEERVQNRYGMTAGAVTIQSIVQQRLQDQALI